MAAVSKKKSHLRHAKRRIEALNFLSNISLDGSSSPTPEQERTRGDDSKLNEENTSDPVVKSTETTRKDEGSASASSVVATGGGPAFGQTKSLTDTPSGSIQCSGNRNRSRNRRVSGGEKSPPVATQHHTPFYHSSSYTGPVAHAIHGHSEHSKRRLFHQQSADMSGSLSQVTEGEMCMLPSSHAVCRVESPKEKSPSSGFHIQVARTFHARMCKNERMLLVTPHHSPFVVYSLLPYTRRSQFGLYRSNSEAARIRRTSGTKALRVQSEDFLATLDGVELGDEGTVVSFSHFLVPTRDLSLTLYRKHLQDLDQLSATSPHSPAIRKVTLTSVSPLQWDKSEIDGHASDHTVLGQRIYDPKALDDPELSLGKHRKLLTFPSYMVSLVDYIKPSELKKDLNDKFKERFPYIELTLSKLRSIKQEMKKVALDICSLDPWILALSYVYYEKLVLHRKINKENRKSCAGTCLILAAKLNDVKGSDLQTLFKETESTFRESRKTLIAFEFPILVALEFSLHVPDHEVLPQLKRVIQQS